MTLRVDAFDDVDVPPLQAEAAATTITTPRSFRFICNLEEINGQDQKTPCSSCRDSVGVSAREPSSASSARRGRKPRMTNEKARIRMTLTERFMRHSYSRFLVRHTDDASHDRQLHVLQTPTRTSWFLL